MGSSPPENEARPLLSPAAKLTIAEASELTGLSKRALARRIERGQLPATKKGGLRRVEARALAAAGLLDLATGAPPRWSQKRMDSDAVAREIVDTLVRQSIELHELRALVEGFASESRHDDDVLRAEIDRARREREELRAALRVADERIAELASRSRAG
jgi:excisionase family DNA binding protein